MARLLRDTMRAPLAAGVSATVLLVALLGTGATLAAFTGRTSNIANAFAADPDWQPPTVTASVVAPVGTRVVPLRPGVSYYVYATVADHGGPPSGVSTVTADLSGVTTGATSVPLVAGSYAIGGTTYGWRSAAITADAGLTSGSYAYTHAVADAAGNGSGVVAGFSASVDATAPTGVDIQATNTSGGTVGRPETGDTLTFSFSEPIEPTSVLAGWDGSATSVVVRFFRSGGSRPMTVRNADNSAQLPLGTTTMSTHSPNNTAVDFVASSMVRSGTNIVITLGTTSGAAQTGTANTMSWTPQAEVTDPAGNPMSVTAVTEGGAADPDF